MISLFFFEILMEVLGPGRMEDGFQLEFCPRG